MINIRIEKRENFISRWFVVRFAALPARIEGGGIRLRHTLMPGGNTGCTVRYRIEKTGGSGKNKKFHHIGFIGLYNIDPQKSAEIAMEISEGERGKGAGSASLGLFLALLRKKRPIADELVARVRADNESALRLFKKFNFSGEASGPGGLFRLRRALKAEK